MKNILMLLLGFIFILTGFCGIVYSSDIKNIKASEVVNIVELAEIDLYFEDSSGEFVTSITPGVTYNLVGTITNNSTVDTIISLDTTLVDPSLGLKAKETSLEVEAKEEVDVSLFGITITPTTKAVEGSINIAFNATEDVNP